MQRLIVWGAGELGGRVAAAWANAHADATALGLTRTTERHGALRAAGVTPQVGAAPAHLQPEDALLLALPGHANQRAALAALADTPPPRRAVFISSTGYYGLASGPVHEQTPPAATERARAIADAEQRFRDWAGESGMVLRLGGLYKAGRGPMAAFARKKRPPARPPDTTLALIHYVDAAAAALAALQRPVVQPVYLAVTPPCPTRREFYTAASAALGLPMPQFGPPRNLPPAHYDVTLLRRDLLPVPHYPDWRAAILQ
jgi:nucleoside-diphosphate-sugar epimerase